MSVILNDPLSGLLDIFHAASSEKTALGLSSRPEGDGWEPVVNVVDEEGRPLFCKWNDRCSGVLFVPAEFVPFISRLPWKLRALDCSSREFACYELDAD